MLPLSLLGGLLVAASASASAPRGAPAASPAPAASAAADTTTRKALVIEGDDHLFMVSAPAGWVLDDTSGMGSRIRCVFRATCAQRGFWSSGGSA